MLSREHFSHILVQQFPKSYSGWSGVDAPLRLQQLWHPGAFSHTLGWGLRCIGRVWKVPGSFFGPSWCLKLLSFAIGVQVRFSKKREWPSVSSLCWVMTHQIGNCYSSPYHLVSGSGSQKHAGFIGWWNNEYCRTSTHTTIKENLHRFHLTLGLTMGVTVLGAKESSQVSIEGRLSFTADTPA